MRERIMAFQGVARETGPCFFMSGMCLDEGSGRSLDFDHNDNPSALIHDSRICLIFCKNQTNFRARIVLGSSSTGDFFNYPHTFSLHG